MSLPNKTVAEALYIRGQDYAIDNYGKEIVLYFPAYLEVSPQPSPGDGVGQHFIWNGSTVLEPTDNPIAGSTTPMIERRDTKTIQLLCTFNPHAYKNSKFKIEPSLRLRMRDELNYIYSKGYQTELANVMRCEFAIFAMPDGQHMKFKLASQLMDKNSIAQGRYFTCWWEQFS